jgi:hypothetical protein
VLLCVLFHAGINFTLDVVGIEALMASKLSLTILLILTVVLSKGPSG